MTDYIKSDSPDAFVDWPEVDRSDWPEGAIECPICKGHGGHNLRLNAYPLHGKEDTPENRHTFSHFRCFCSTCWGWGYLPADDPCPHDWSGETRKIGNCLHEWTCVLCGKARVVDTSG